MFRLIIQRKTAALLFSLDAAFIMTACVSTTSHAEEYNEVFELIDKTVELFEAEKYEEAIPYAEKMVVEMKKAFGPLDPTVALGYERLGEIYEKTGMPEKAVAAYKKALEIREKSPEPGSSFYIYILGTLGRLYQEMKEIEKAAGVYERLIKIKEKVRGDTIDTADTYNELADLYYEMKEYSKAEPLYKRALEIYEKKLGPDSGYVLWSLRDIGVVYKKMKRFAEAEDYYKRALKMSEKKYGPEHGQTARDLNRLGVLYYDMKEYSKAEPMYRRAIEIREKISFFRKKVDMQCNIDITI